MDSADFRKLCERVKALEIGQARTQSVLLYLMQCGYGHHLGKHDTDRMLDLLGIKDTGEKGGA